MSNYQSYLKRHTIESPMATMFVEKLAKAGAQIPGVTITEVHITAAKG